MAKIVALGLGEQGTEIINEMIERKTEGLEFATTEDTSKIFDHTDMIFIIFQSLGKDNTCGLALEIAKAAKLADILTIAVPISGDAEDEDIKNFKDFSDAIILSNQEPRKVYLNIEAIVSFIAQERLDLSNMKDVFHNIGSVFVQDKRINFLESPQ